MITLTEKAQNRVKNLIDGDPEKTALRIKVVGGGCGGMEYKLDLVDAPEEGDKVLDGDGWTVYVDKKSYLFVANTVLDWKEDVMGARFDFQNPQVTGTCGCGQSFYVQ